jgi:hypothetical protein
VLALDRDNEAQPSYDGLEDRSIDFRADALGGANDARVAFAGFEEKLASLANSLDEAESKRLSRRSTAS